MKHLVRISPIDLGARGYRSECDTCGTVLRLHPTVQEANEWADLHADDPETYKHAPAPEGV